MRRKRWKCHWFASGERPSMRRREASGPSREQALRHALALGEVPWPPHAARLATPV